MKRGSILVLGDPGPVRNDLLMRADLEILWMSHLEDALALVREGPVHVVLIGPEVEAQGARKLLLASSAKQIACLLLVDPKQRAPIVPSIAAHAAAVIPTGQIESVLALVGFHTGLPFSKDARATIEAPVRATIGRETHELETANLSVSGVAIYGLPKLPSGTPAKLEISLSIGTVSARARVVRWAKEGKRSVTGFAFTELSLIDRERILKLVEAARRESPSSQLRVADLFGDISLDCSPQSALSTDDLNTSSDLVGVEQLLDVRSEYAQLERWEETALFDQDAPEWLPALASDLTQVENFALAGGTVPEWVQPAMLMRLALARARFASGQGRLPSMISAKAYRTFLVLADVAAGSPPTLVTQIAKIRAALLRDLLGTHRMIRAGSTSAPDAKLSVRTSLPRARRAV